MAELARGYVTIVPVFEKGSQGKIAKELGASIDTAAAQISGKGGKELTEKALQGLDKATSWVNNKVLSLGKNIVKAGAIAAAGVVSAAATTGLDRAIAIENAEAKLRGLGNTQEQVAAIMNDALSAVRGTAYGLGDAATAAGVLSAAGIKAGKGIGQMEDILSTIASTAAASGSSFDSMASIFAKAAARGSVNNEIFQQLLDRGVPVLNILADKFGVTTAEIQDMAAKGEIGFQEFANAVGEYMGEAADEMGDTFEGRLMNTKAALARVGETFMGPIKGGISAALPGIMETLDEFNAQAKAKIEEIKMDPKVNEAFSNLRSTLEDIKNKLADFAEELFGTSDPAEILAGAITNLNTTLENLQPVFAVVSTVVLILAKALGFLSEHGEEAIPLLLSIAGIIATLSLGYSGARAVQKVVKAVKDFKSAAEGVAGKAGEAATGIGDVGKSAQKLDPKQILANAASMVALGAALALASVGIYVMAKAAVLLAEQGVMGIVAFAVVGVVLAGLAFVLSKVGGAANAAIPFMLAFSLAMILLGAAIALAAPGIAQIVDALGTALPPVIQALGSLIETVGTQIVNILNAIGDNVTKVGATIEDVIQQAGDSVSQVVGAISDGITSIIDTATNSLERIGAIDFSNLADNGILAGAGLGAIALGLAGIVLDGPVAALALVSIAKEIESISSNAQSAADGLSSVEGQSGLLQSAGDTLKAAFDGIKEAIANAFNGDTSNIDAATTSIAAAGGAALGFAAPLQQAASSTVSIAAGMGIARSSAQILGAAFLSLPGMMGQVAAAGIKMGNQVATAARQAQSQVPAAMRAAVSQAVSVILTGVGQMRSVGYQLGAGVAAGMRQALPGVSAAANAIVAEANRAAQAKAKIHSPSRLMRDEVGYWLGAGVAAGIDAAAPVVETSVEGLISMPQMASTLDAGFNAFSPMQYSTVTSGGTSVYIDGARVNSDADITRLIYDFMQELARKGYM